MFIKCIVVIKICHFKDYQLYSKSKLELEFNLSEILPVNCKFVRCSTPT